MSERSERVFRVIAAGAAVACLALLGCGKADTPATAQSTLPDTPTIVGNVVDVDVTEHVKTALQSNDALKGFDIRVVTLKGDVRMTGTLDTQAQKDEAIGIAKAAEGVHSIHDEIVVKQ
jgi:hyperosmotically inducible periplasmic protein